MEKYVSSVHTAYAPIERVYEKLSDLTHLQSMQERVDDPNFIEDLKARVPADKMPDEEKLQQIRDAVRQMTFTTDSVTSFT